MVRKEITLQILMIDGVAGNIQDKWYYMALREELMLRIHESLVYVNWRRYLPLAQKEYDAFKWFWGRLKRRGENISHTVRNFVNLLMAENFGDYQYGLLDLLHGGHDIEGPGQDFPVPEGSKGEKSDDDASLFG